MEPWASAVAILDTAALENVRNKKKIIKYILTSLQRDPTRRRHICYGG
jgi:hypothetical protein